MKNVLSLLSALIYKDLLIEYRSRQIVTAVGVFALTLVVIFAFNFDLVRFLAKENTAGIIWTAFTFAGILGLSRSFILEYDKGSITGVLLSPADRSLIYVAKVASNFVFLTVIESVLLPVLVAFLNLKLDFNVLLLLAVILLGSLGYVAVGTFLSAVTANTRLRELLLPILLFPVLTPLLIASVKLTNLIINAGRAEEVSSWLGLLVIYDLLFFAVSYFIFESVVEG